jgi:hypothetical protein
MKNVANRLIVFAASALAFGTVAFGQNRMTAEIPFAFQTATGTLPAGTYTFTRAKLNGSDHLITVQNVATYQSLSAGIPMFDDYDKAGKSGASIDFACVAGKCSLKAVRTVSGTMVYLTPRRPRAEEKASPMALVTIPAKVSNGD